MDSERGVGVGPKFPKIGVRLRGMRRMLLSLCLAVVVVVEEGDLDEEVQGCVWGGMGELMAMCVAFTAFARFFQRGCSVGESGECAERRVCHGGEEKVVCVSRSMG